MPPFLTQGACGGLVPLGNTASRPALPRIPKGLGAVACKMRPAPPARQFNSLQIFFIYEIKKSRQRDPKSLGLATTISELRK
jgi:hypothetical protein